MSKKGYLHIAEYDLTKKILDLLDIDIEDDYELINGLQPLYYKDNKVILPSYDKCINYLSEGVIFRPFSNVNHATYLMNLFGDIKKYDVVFEYKDGKDNTLDGTLTMRHKKKGDITTKFYGLKNESVLIATLVMKALSSSALSTCIGNVFKIDRKVSDKHKPEEK